jgi:hypothetical protein
MSETLTLQLSDPLAEAVRKAAAERRLAPEEWIVSYLSGWLLPPPNTKPIPYTFVPQDQLGTLNQPRPPVTSRPLTPVERRMAEDTEWAFQAPEVLEHIGKVVLIRNKRVVAVGDRRADLLDKAAAQEGCEPWELVVIVVPSDEFWETSN